jgi:5-methylcytosine-specific restriction protein A
MPCQRHRDVRSPHGAELDARYRQHQWHAYSRRFRALHPWCARCGRLAECVDHIVPVRRAPDRFWDPTNHQALCWLCNNIKALEER